MRNLIFILMGLLLASCMSLKRKFLNEPEKAAELCLKHYGCKDVESIKTVDIEYDTVLIPGETIECPPSVKPIEKTDKDGNKVLDSSGKPIIEYIEVPGEKVKCPDKECVNTNTKTNTTIKIRDKAQDEVVKNLSIENEVLKKKIKSQNTWIIILGSVIGLYIVYRVVKSKINFKLS